jgi:DNA-binding NtrC family response regulator
LSDQSPLVVVALVNDLFFSVKLGNQIKRAGFSPRIVKTEAQFRAALESEPVALGIVDLSSRVDLAALQVNSAEADDQVIPIIAFGPHKDVDAFRDAKTAGLTRVVSNSMFHAQTVEMIQRYARTDLNKSR